MKKFFAVFASVALLAFAVPAMAQEGDVAGRLAALEEAFQCSWKFYGSARMTTFWEKTDAAATGTGFDGTDLIWYLQGISRIGAQVKLGDVTGRFEYGHGPNPTLRLLFGEWNFGAGKLTVGQDYTPMTFWVANQVARGDYGLLGYGQLYMGRHPQIKLTMGNFQIAAVRPNTGVAVPGHANDDVDTTVPRLVLGYDVKTGPLSARIAGAYQTYDVVDRTTVPGVEREDSVDAWQIAAGAIYNMGTFFLKGNAYFGENIRNLGQSSEVGAVAAGPFAGAAPDRANWNGTSMVDADTLGATLAAGFKLNDMWTFEIGYGMANNEIEDAGGSLDQDVKSYYINATISLAKGVFIVPEIGKFDFGDQKLTGAPDVDMGSAKYFGAKWQINF